MDLNNDLRLVFPVLKPGNWVGIKSGALYEELLSIDSYTYVVKGYGYDLVSEFRFLTQNDLQNLSPNDIRIQAQKNIEEYEVQVQAITQLNSQVLLIQDDSFAAEKVCDPNFMNKLSEHLNTNEIIAAIPRRGTLIVAPERLQQKIYDGFLSLINSCFNDVSGLAPITSIILTLESGQITGAFEP